MSPSRNRFRRPTTSARRSRTPTATTDPSRIDRRYDSLAVAEIRQIDDTGATELHFRADELSSSDFAQLDKLDSIVRLGLYGLYRSQLAAAATCGSKIVALELHGQEINDDDLKTIAGFAALETLEIGCNDITDQGLASLTTLEHLEELSAGSNHLCGAGLSEWRAPLRSLQLSELKLPFSVEAGEAVGAFSLLSNLRLTIIELESGALRPLARLGGLGQLSLLGSKPCNQDLRFLAGFGSLEGLSLALTDTDNDGLRWLAATDTLVELDLNGTGVTDSAFLGRFSQLRVLDLRGTGVNDVTPLRDLHLERLDLSGSWIDSSVVEELSNFACLKELTIRRASLDERGLQALSRLGHLHTLNVDKIPLTDAMVSALCDLPALQTLHAVGCRVKERHSRVFRQRRPSLRVLL